MAKTQLNIRVGESTREKINWLRTRYGSQAQAVAVAVDRLYTSEHADGREAAQAEDFPTD